MAMPQKRTAVVAVDYSETGLLALRRALALGEVDTLHIVHVVELASPIGVASMPVQVQPASTALDDEKRILHEYVERHVSAARTSGEAGGISRVVSHLVLGNPADEIVQLASDLDADLIVIGTHGRRGVQRFVLGSIAERVVRFATCPVLVERPKSTPADKVPQIEPPCQRCIETRQSTEGRELWCAQHRERHGRRHTFHSRDTKSAFPSSHGGLGSVT